MYPAVSRLRVCGEWRLPRLGKVFNVVISPCFPSERWSLFCSWLLVSQIIVTLYRHPFVDSISNLPCPLYCIAWFVNDPFLFDYSLAARSALLIDYLAHWPFLSNKRLRLWNIPGSAFGSTGKRNKWDNRFACHRLIYLSTLWCSFKVHRKLFL